VLSLQLVPPITFKFLQGNDTICQQFTGFQGTECLLAFVRLLYGFGLHKQWHPSEPDLEDDIGVFIDVPDEVCHRLVPP
jgi:hypothetical protein